MNYKIGDFVKYHSEIWTIFYISEYRMTKFSIERNNQKIYGCCEEEFDYIIDCPEYFKEL